jgi:hypothetical protein
MLTTRTPDAITDPVRRLCQQIRPGLEPVFLPIRPEAGSAPLDCFASVRRKVDTDGGRIQFGWAIWEWPRVYLEAEHHAVYEPPAGPPWLDITPAAEPELRRRLFLPDDTAVYDFENEGVFRDNVRMALADDPLIQELFRASRERVRILNTIPGVGAVAVDRHTAAQMAAVEENKARIIYELALKYTPKTARCFCGSGEKFKQCHGRRDRGQQ